MWRSWRLQHHKLLRMRAQWCQPLACRRQRGATRRGRWFGRRWQGAAGLTWFSSGGVGKVEALQLQKSIVAVLREVGPKLGDLHWREATGMGQKSRVLPAEAAGMLEAARHARMIRDPGWVGDRGQGR